MSTPLWLFDERLPLFDRLVENIKTDVCVIGGGLGGLTTAYLLLKEGKKVCLIEDSLIGSGQSGRTMAQFSNCLDNRYFNIEKNHGPLGAYLAANSHTTALEFVENIIHSENIDCDFKKVDGYLFNPNEGQDKKLAREIQALHRSGLLRVSFISKTPLDSFDSGPCLHFPNQIQLHPIKYMKGLAQCILKYGGKIFNSSHAQEVKGGPTTLVKIKGGYNIQAKATVVATNAPINDLLALPIKQAAYRTYVLAFKIPPGSIRDGFYWDTEDPYHYMEVANDDTLLVGGEDHKTGQNNFPESSYRKIEEWTRQRFPFTQEIVAQWSGQIMKTLDGLAYLGRCPPIDGRNIYVITGDCGNGTTHCTIGALLISDLIMGRSNSWEALYNPSRINLKVTGAFVKENANMAVQFTHWMRGKNIDALEDLKREEGLVFKKGLERLAAYKDDMGRVEIMSAVCPHLGCIVAWNNAEKSWDCPCHGSRFDCHGKVIEGPASSDLKSININENESKEGMITINPLVM